MVLATGYVSDYIYMRDSSGSGKDYNDGLGDYWRREIPNTSGNLKRIVLMYPILLEHDLYIYHFLCALQQVHQLSI